MPVIPQYFSKVKQESLELPEIPLGAGSQVYKAMQQAGESMRTEGERWAQKIHQEQQAAQLSSSMASATVQIHDLRNSILSSAEFNTDPGAARKSWDERVQQLGSEIAGQMNDAQARALFQNQYAKLAAAHTASFGDAVFGQQKNINRGATLNALDQFSQAAAVAPDENTFMEIEKNAHATLMGSIASGAVEYDTGVRLWEHWKNSTGSGRAHMQLAVKDPDQVIKELDSGSRAYQGLSPTTKASIIDSAERRKDTLTNRALIEASRQDRIIEKQLKQEQDDTEMDLFSRVGEDPQLMMQIEDARKSRTLRPDAYRALKKAVWEEDGVENKVVALGLEEKVLSQGATGNAEQLRSDIMAVASEPGGISYKTASRLLNKLRDVSRADDVSKSPLYQQNMKFVEENLRTKGLLQDLDLDAQSRIALAKREFDDRTRKGEDPKAVADDIVPRYRATPLTAASFPRPRRLAGPVNDLDALAKAEVATVSDFKEDRIDKDAFLFEMENLKRIREAVQRQQEADAQINATRSDTKRKR